MIHIAIPSKGRPKTKTHTLLPLPDCKVTHFVEPQETAAYAVAGVPNIVTLPENDQGIAYVRNFILDWAASNRVTWLWVIDDDVNGFGTAKAGKTIKGDHQVLVDFQAKAEQYKFPVNGINYCQYAWSYSAQKGSRYRVNRKTAEVCTLLYIPAVTWRYRGRLNLKEDRDFCMQAIKESRGILFDCCSWFNAPGVGTNPGGLQDLYRQKRDWESAARLHAEWSPFAEMIHKSGRHDCRLDLAGYAKSLGKTVK